MGSFGSANSFPSLNAGDLRHWITFLYQTVTPGLTGPNISWIPASPSTGAWAKIESLRGAERFSGGQDLTQLFVTITIWWQPNLPSTLHILAPTGAEYVVLSTENVLLLNHILIFSCQVLGAQANFGG